MNLRARIRSWLGIDSIDDIVLAVSDLPSVEMYKAMEQAQRGRHEVLVKLLNEINQRMANQHVGAPRVFAPPFLDWDTVQAIALKELEENQPKEVA